MPNSFKRLISLLNRLFSFPDGTGMGAAAGRGKATVCPVVGPAIAGGSRTHASAIQLGSQQDIPRSGAGGNRGMPHIGAARRASDVGRVQNTASAAAFRAGPSRAAAGNRGNAEP